MPETKTPAQAPPPKHEASTPPKQHGRPSDVTRRDDVRHVERGHGTPPRAETNKERTNSTDREKRR